MRANITKTAHAEPMVLYKFMLLALLTVALYTASVSMAYAAITPMGNVLCLIVFWVYGNLGRGLATLAVIIIGAGATLGKVSWGLAITVAIGISIIFNASAIVTALTGTLACT